jgi:hypothetical protein
MPLAIPDAAYSAPNLINKTMGLERPRLCGPDLSTTDCGTAASLTAYPSSEEYGPLRRPSSSATLLAKTGRRPVPSFAYTQDRVMIRA